MERVCILLSFITLINIVIGTSHVARTKNTNKDFLDLKETENYLDDVTKLSKEKKEYLNDVLLSLNNENWTLEEEQCVGQIKRMIQGVRNFTLWSVWGWDSQSAPQGVLFGNKYQLGNFDQCMNPPWLESHKDLQMKYCLADIVLEINDTNTQEYISSVSPYQSALEFMQNRPPRSRPLNELSWGVCVPASCPTSAIKKLVNAMLTRTHLAATGIKRKIEVAEKCPVAGEHREPDGLFYSFVTLVSSLAIISIACTYCTSTKRLSSDTIGTNMIRAFCLRENASNLLKINRDGLEVFYGIKWLSIFFLTLNHLTAIHNSGPISDGLTFDQMLASMFGYYILHTDLFVDSFFFLSGFLTFTTFVKIKNLPNPLLIIFKRYIRLVVALAVVIFYVCAVQSYTGDGPLWHGLVDFEVEVCRKNWWLNVLMISNYVDTKNMCLIVSWYIPCDFHFFIVTLFLFMLYKKYRRVGIVAASVSFMIALSIPGIITYIYQLPAVQDFTYQFLVNPRSSEHLHILYIKSHARYATYLVGVLYGFIYIRYKDEDKQKTMSKSLSILGAISGLFLMLATMTYGSSFLWREYQPIESAVYAALNRPAWACGLGLIVMSCSFGKTPLVHSILTWYPWAPLSRMTYGIFFTHTIIIARNVFITRNPPHNDYLKTIIEGTGTVFVACIFALLLWLLAEAPINKLFDILLKSLITNIKGQDLSREDNPKISYKKEKNTKEL